MRAIRYHDTGGTEVISIDDIEPLTPCETEVSIDVRAIGVNPSDVLRREGTLDYEVPFIPGKDVAGVITDVGTDVRDFQVGDRVFGYIPNSNVPGADVDRQGTYADHVVSRTDRLAHLPESVTFETGAAVAAVGVTAWKALVTHGDVKAGESCVIHGGTGGVGHVAVQLASAMGCHVVTTASGTEKRQRALAFGADDVIDYARADLETALIETVPTPPTLVLDHMVGEYLPLDVDVVSRRGTIAVVGGVGDSLALDSVAAAMLKNVTIVPFTVSLTQDIQYVLNRLARLMATEQLSVVVAETFPLKAVAEAQRTVVNESFVGKIVMTP